MTVCKHQSLKRSCYTCDLEERDTWKACADLQYEKQIEVAKKCEWLKKKLAVAVEALEFYGEEEHWKFLTYNGKSGFDAALVSMQIKVKGRPAWEEAKAALTKITGVNE